MKDYATLQRESFHEEAKELLSKFEQNLMDLEQTPKDKDLLNDAFRSIHTIKGSSAMCGLNDIAEFLHDLENVMDMARKGVVPIDNQLIDLALAVSDQVNAMLRHHMEGVSIDSTITKDLCASVRFFCDSITGEKEQPPASLQVEEPPKKSAAPPNADMRCININFLPNPEIFQQGMEPLLLLDELGELGRTQITADISRISELDKMDPMECALGWDIWLITDKPMEAVHEIFEFVADDSTLVFKEIPLNLPGTPSEIGAIRQKAQATVQQVTKEMGAMARAAAAYAKGHRAPSAVRKESSEASPSLMKTQIPTASPPPPVERGIPAVFRSLPLEPTILGPTSIVGGLNEAGSGGPGIQKMAEEKNWEKLERPAQQNIGHNFYASPERFDRLVGFIGGLMSMHSRIKKTADAYSHIAPEWSGLAEEAGNLTAELRDMVMSIRMLPVNTLFSKFTRVVKDLGVKLDREVELIIEGDETKMDKSILERMGNPLTQLLRNAVAHGIEPPETRALNGKPRHGTIKISAAKVGSYVEIRVEEDGAGIDPQAIRERALEKGLMSSDMEKSAEDLLNLVFTPGFSMAKNITPNSGRGVGMDIVKRGILAMRGTVNLESAPGRGTHITMRLPMTLATIDALLLKTAEELFVVPLSLTEECLELEQEALADLQQVKTVTVRDTQMPCVRLRDKFGYQGDAPPVEHVVVCTVQGQRLGIVVDHVIGAQQTVLKSTGRVYSQIEHVSGTSLLADANLALNLNVNKLLVDSLTEQLSEAPPIPQPYVSGEAGVLVS